MSYSASGLPGGLSINNSTGLISGTLASGAASGTPYDVTVTANDGTSSSSQTFAWTVSAINLASPGDRTNNDGDAVNLSEYSHPSPPPLLPCTQGRGENPRGALYGAQARRGPLPAV